MTKHVWFAHLVALSHSERKDELAALQQINPAMAHELIGLLAHDFAVNAALDDLSAGDLTDALSQAVQAKTSVPNFKLMGLLGQGGMGEVWRAERIVAGVSQTLALKLLKHECNNAELHERFIQEQRILLQLAHPNIARLLDAGTAGDGRPRIAMELVEGLPITTFCDKNKLSIKARIKLFRQVLGAVQYAHDFLVVHRDIKPDNVWVSIDGVVKLLDFGIAKSIDRHAPQTLTQQRFLSLYATAPEQLLGGAVCVGTDVYALGGLLYELLSGAQLMGSELKTPTQLETFIVQKTPILPSKRATLEAAGQRKLGSALVLSRQLAGDLDRIVLHALRKLPNERYASAREFDEDLQAYLELRPVKAAGQGRRYRTEKFLRRHWLAVAGSSAVIISLLALITMLAIGWVDLQRANRLALANQSRAEAQQRSAEDARAAAESVNDFLVDVFKRADPLATERGDKSLSVMIDASFAEIKERQNVDPASAPLLIALARGLTALGKTERAGAMISEIERKIPLSQQHKLECLFLAAEIASIERETTDLGAFLIALKELNLDFSLDETRRFQLLEVNYFVLSGQSDRILKILPAQILSSAAEAIRIDVLIKNSKLKEAQLALVIALDNSKSIKEKIVLLGKQAALSQQFEQYEEVLHLRSQIKAMAVPLLGPDHSSILAYDNDLASALMKLGRFEEAEILYEAISQKTLIQFKLDDPRHNYLAFNMAIMQAKQGKLVPKYYQRLLRAADGGISILSMGANVALARNAYLIGNKAEFSSRILRFDCYQSPEIRVTREMIFWRSVQNGKLGEIVKAASEMEHYDPIVLRIKNCRIKDPKRFSC